MRNCLLILVFGFLISELAVSQTQALPTIDAAKLPHEIRRLADFEFPGWRIESTAQLDINRDKRLDALLTLSELSSKQQASAATTKANHKLLVVLLKTPAGAYRRVAVAQKLLRCAACFGVVSGAEGGVAEIKPYKKGFFVEETWGSREIMTTRFFFSYHARSKRVRLVAEEIECFDRLTGAGRRIRRNLLAGVELTEAYHYAEKPHRLIKKPLSEKKIGKVTRYIEDVDYQDYEALIER
jgi:hypothetical protein